MSVIIGIIVSLFVTTIVPFIISSLGVHLANRKKTWFCIINAVLSFVTMDYTLWYAFRAMDYTVVSSSVGIAFSLLTWIISLFFVPRIISPSSDVMQKKYPNASTASFIINKCKEDNTLDIFANGVCSDILASYKDVQLLEQKIINSNLSPQAYAYNDLISTLEERLEWVAYRGQSTHELNEKGQKLLDIQQKIIKDLENFKNPEATPSVAETASSEPTNNTTVKTQNLTVEIEAKATELKINNAKTISKQVKSIVMDIDNKVGIEVFTEHVAMPVWKKANDLNGIQTAFEKSGLSVEQFASQSLIFEINNVLSSVSDNEVLSLQLNPIKEMLERNYSQYSTEVPREPQATVENKKAKLPTIKVPKKSFIFAVSSILIIAITCTATFFITKEIVSKDSYKNGYDSGYDVAKFDANEQYEKGRKDGYTEGREVGYNVGYLDGDKEGERKANEKAKEAVASRQTVTLTPGNYKVGTDIAAGRYKLVAVSGSGYVSSTGSLYAEGIGVNSDYYQNEYTATLAKGADLRFSDVTIKFVPV